MSFAFYRNAVVALAMFAATASIVIAQEHDEHIQSNAGACGSFVMESPAEHASALENTRLKNPDLYARIKGKSYPRGLKRGLMYDEITFLVRNRVLNELEEVQGALVYTGPYSRVWVDVRDTNKSTHKPTSTIMQLLFKALDVAPQSTVHAPRSASQGILKNDIDVFGNIPLRWIDEDRTDFLLLDIPDKDPRQGNVLGYFQPLDQLDANESNKRNLLYIDSKEGFAKARDLFAIIAHEFQHLIHYGRHERTSSDQVFNEGLSEVASILNGYLFRDNRSYLANTDVGLFEWDYDSLGAQLTDYAMAMTFVHYLSEHYGEQLLYELVGAADSNMTRLDNALRAYGLPANYNHKEVLKGYAVANWVQSSSNFAYNYKIKLQGGAAKPHEQHTGTTFPASKSRSLQPYGTYYVHHINPGPMKWRFSGSPDIRVMMIGMRAKDTTITELMANTEYTLPIWGFGANYTRLAFAIINTGSAVRDANWTASALPSGVEGPVGDAAQLAIEGIAVYKDGNASIEFTLPVSGVARIDLFDMRGAIVRNVIDDLRQAGSQRDPLDLSGLASGTYVARLVHNGKVASQKGKA
ncbi:MAG: T9SS type A sorting domain-containing protein, partial [bacterium]|nr:T9SS type A sorting domain-containing protein [Candidatus Kapabacteria bacterium]